LGRIINIGKGGLTFLYANNEQSIIGRSKMGMFLANGGFRLAEIPYKVVSEFDLKGQPSNYDLIICQCCVAFGQLTQFQNASLNYYLENYTTD
jgi:hypothetical protein